MTEEIEQAVEMTASGVLFCIAVAMLLLLHTGFYRQSEIIGKMPEQLILFEEAKETWKHLEE